MRRCIALLVVGVGFLPGVSQAQQAGSLEPTVFAIRDARVVTEPGHVLSTATVVIRDGRIQAVGAAVKAPADALVIDGKGLTVYPGFIDALSNWGFDASQRHSQIGDIIKRDFASEALAATRIDNRKGVTPEFEVSSALKADATQTEMWRKAGFTAHLIAPEGGFITGQSAVVSLSGAPSREALVQTPVALHLAFSVVPGTDYPRVLMGIIAHCRQTLLDAGYYQRRWCAYEQAGRTGPRPPYDPSLAALGKALRGELPVICEADTSDEIHRALDFAHEFHLHPIIYGGRDAGKVVDRLKKEKVPVVLRLHYTDADGHRLERRQPSFFMRFHPPVEEKDLPPRVEAEHKRLLHEDLHTAAVLAKHGVLFAFSTQGQPAKDGGDRFREMLHRVITEGGLSPDDALKALTVNTARLLGIRVKIGTIAPGAAAHLVVIKGDFQDNHAPMRYVFADGVRFDYTTPATGKDKDTRSASRQGKRPNNIDKKNNTTKPTLPPNKQATELDADRKPHLHTGGNVLIRGGTVLTVSHGTLTDMDILIQSGKITQIGRHLTAPAGMTEILAKGMFVMPGIIDTHCHFAIAGSVNEFSESIVPEVRVRDVVDSSDVQIYRGLAGGVTTARLLHGSANCIGGQDAVIKMKYGKPAAELILHAAPRGVKFALGENVKRTNGRFPNTRLGVETVLVRAFSEAQAYATTWQAYKKNKPGGQAPIEPRRDLRLEALADILRGDLRVHSHCYRQDEILMLMQTAERFGFRIRSLHHVLEGYKIAAEIARHGASCSTFADWWAYKMESYDAIPYNAALLNEAGVTVCIKSDSNELMRHLYQEAAKCIKYGGMSEEDALKTITINGAKQLGLDKRTGSIDVGKDGDIVIFNGHPFNSYARPEMTLVEGEVYFQRSDRLQPRAIAAATPNGSAKSFKDIARNHSGSYVLTDVTVHPVSGPVLEHGTVIVQAGKIRAVLRGVVQSPSSPRGKDTSALTIADRSHVNTHPVPSGTTVVRLHGRHVYPGMIDSFTVLGLSEVASVQETLDYRASGLFQPDLRACIGINPDSELIPVTRANGVLTALTSPRGAIISGQSALIDLAGWTPREMTLVDGVGLHIRLPQPRPVFRRGMNRSAAPNRAELQKQSDEQRRRLEQLFLQAQAYGRARKLHPERPVNARLEAMVPYALGQKPVIFDADTRKEILEALAFAGKLKLKPIIQGGLETWKVTDELKKHKAAVIFGPVMSLPEETFDPYDGPYTCPAKLYAAGVPFCIGTYSVEMGNDRNLPYEAAMAVAYGLPLDEGLKAVTLYPAQILGVADQLGSIEAGKRANLVITDGDMLQATTQVLGLFIDGKPLPPTSKHTRLYERYRERLHEIREGEAPLGMGP